MSADAATLFPLVKLTRKTYVCPSAEEVPHLRRDTSNSLTPSSFQCIYEAPHTVDDLRQILKFTLALASKASKVGEMKAIVKECDIRPQHFCLFYDPDKHAVHAALYMVESGLKLNRNKLRLVNANWLRAVWDVKESRCRDIYAAGNWDDERQLPMLPTKLLALKEQPKAQTTAAAAAAVTGADGDTSDSPSSAAQSVVAKQIAEVRLNCALNDLFSSTMEYVRGYAHSIDTYMQDGPTMCVGVALARSAREKFTPTQHTKSNSIAPRDLDSIGFFQVDACNTAAGYIVDALIKAQEAPGAEESAMETDNGANLPPQIQLPPSPVAHVDTTDMSASAKSTQQSRIKRTAAAASTTESATVKRSRASENGDAAALSNNDASLFVHWLSDSVLTSAASPLAKTAGVTSTESEQLVWSRAGFLLGSQQKDSPSSDVNIKKALARAADMVAQRGEYEAGGELSTICKETSLLDVMCKRTPNPNKLVTGVILPCLTLGTVALLQQMAPEIHKAHDAMLMNSVSTYHDKKVDPLLRELAAAKEMLSALLPTCKAGASSDTRTLAEICVALTTEVESLRKQAAAAAANKPSILDQPVAEADLF